MKYLTLTFVFFISFVAVSSPVKAFSCPDPHVSESDTRAYQNHCGIWLCLPAKFYGSECNPQKRTFKKRVAKKDCSPLPSYSRCSGGGSGSYNMGMDFLPCKQGYSMRINRDDDGRRKTATCMNTDRGCVRRRGRDDEDRSACNDYGTPRKRYIDVIVNGQKYPRYWW